MLHGIIIKFKHIINNLQRETREEKRNTVIAPLLIFFKWFVSC